MMQLTLLSLWSLSTGSAVVMGSFLDVSRSCDTCQAEELRRGPFERFLLDAATRAVPVHRRTGLQGSLGFAGGKRYVARWRVDGWLAG